VPDGNARLDRIEKDMVQFSTNQSRTEVIVEGIAGEISRLTSTVTGLAEAMNRHMQTAGRMDMRTIISGGSALMVGYWALTDRAVAPLQVITQQNSAMVEAMKSDLKLHESHDGHTEDLIQHQSLKGVVNGLAGQVELLQASAISPREFERIASIETAMRAIYVRLDFIEERER
jgi:hypothetical protein